VSALTPLEEARDRLFAFLGAHGVDDMLLGGLAVRLHAIPRPTYDTDLLVGIGAEGVGRLASAAVAAGFSVPEEHARGFVDRLAGLSKFSLGVPVGDRIVSADLLVLGSDFQKTAFGRCVRVPVDGGDEWAVSVEDLLLHKLLAFRPRDQADISDLLLVAGPLDQRHLVAWAKRLGVEDRLREVFRVAGRGDPGV
jgi:hypothetical protein